MAEELQRYRVQQDKTVQRLVQQYQDDGNLVDWAQIAKYAQLNQATCKFLAGRAGLLTAVESAPEPAPPPSESPVAEEPAEAPAPRRRVKLRRDEDEES